MWWGMGFTLGIIWLTLLVVLGISTLRRGHTVLFIIGLFFPFLWVFGAVMPPTDKAARNNM